MSNLGKQLVKVITDSTADMPEEMQRRLGVDVIPLTVLIGDESYRDGIDITPREFYQRLPKLSKLPTTSQPAPGLFMEAFQTAISEGYSVISLHLSGKLSGTYANAQTASTNFPEGKIRVMDTGMISAALAMFVQVAAEMAKKGHKLEEIMLELESMRDRVKLIATVATLEYLHKGGRIGGMRNLFGSLLSVKPLLYLKDGTVQPLEQVRTRSKALQRAAALIKDMGKAERMAIMHASDPDSAGELASMLSSAFPLKDMFISEIGPVIGAHVGQGTVGICITKAKDVSQ